MGLIKDIENKYGVDRRYCSGLRISSHFMNKNSL